MPTSTRTPEDTLRSVLIIAGLALLILSPAVHALRGRVLRMKVRTNHMRSRGRLWLENPGAGTAAVGELLIDAAETH